MIEAVAFDLDDTLYLERDYVRSGFRTVDAHLRAVVDPRRDWFGQLWRGFEEGVRGDAFNRVLEWAGAEPSPSDVAELVRVYREHRPDIRLCDDALQTLQELAVPPERRAVITDGPVVCQAQKFEALGLAGLFGHLICTDAWGLAYRKPHPRAFEEFEKRTGVAAGFCAYVADNPAKDFEAPHRRGWLTVRLKRAGGLHSDEPAVPGEIDEVLSDLRGLRGVLSRERR